MKDVSVEFLCLTVSPKEPPQEKTRANVVFEVSSYDQVPAKVINALIVISDMHPECRIVAEWPVKRGFMRLEHAQDHRFLETRYKGTAFPDRPSPKITDTGENPFGE